MIGGGWLLVPWIFGLLACFGLPLAAVGGILCLCEWSWQKPPGTLGGPGLVAAGLLLCAPLAILLAGCFLS